MPKIKQQNKWTENEGSRRASISPRIGHVVKVQSSAAAGATSQEVLTLLDDDTIETIQDLSDETHPTLSS